MKRECVSKEYLNGDLPKMWYEKSTEIIHVIMHIET